MKKLLMKTKRIWLVLLCVIMVAAGIPAAAFAEEAVTEEPAPTETVETLPEEQPSPEPVEPSPEVQPAPEQQERQPLPGRRDVYGVPQDYSLHTVINRVYTGAPLYVNEVFDMLQAELAEAINIISSEIECYDVQVFYNHGSEDAYHRSAAEIVAVFGARENWVESVLMENRLLSAEQVNLLHSIYWDMVKIEPFYRAEINYYYSDDGSQILESKTYHMQIDISFIPATEYMAGSSNAQMVVLESLLAEPARSNIENLCSGMISKLDTTAVDVMAALPEDLDPTRRNVVAAACSLADKVPYFWGGKSDMLGWDDRWNVPMTVTIGGTGQVGDVLPYGLDCAGLITWAFINGAETLDALSYIGHGVESQFYNCVESRLDAVQPGDLLFGVDPNGGYGHVGIVVGRNAAGEILVCHCSMEGNGKVRIEPAGMTNLAMARVPVEFYNAY